MCHCNVCCRLCPELYCSQDDCSAAAYRYRLDIPSEAIRRRIETDTSTAQDGALADQRLPEIDKALWAMCCLSTGQLGQDSAHRHQCLGAKCAEPLELRDPEALVVSAQEIGDRTDAGGPFKDWIEGFTPTTDGVRRSFSNLGYEQEATRSPCIYTACTVCEVRM